MHTRWLIAGLVAIAAAPAGLSAQTYNELILKRDRLVPYSTVFQVRAGLLGGFTTDADPPRGLENQLGWDGHVYFHQEAFADRESILDLYAGRDGGYLSITEGDLVGRGTQTRLEVTGRYFPFYRQGFYSGDQWIPTGRYRGDDYGAGLYLARQPGEGFLIEGGVFYLRRNFRRTDETASNFVIPENYNSFGFKTFIEHSTLTLDRTTDRPDAGFSLTGLIEYELNDAGQPFGAVGVSQSTLPRGVWRGVATLDWYVPTSEATTLGFHVDGLIADDRDRVYIYDAQKPIGHLWGDGSVSFRIDLGRAFWITPSLRGQYVKTLNETQSASDANFFWGGGLDAGVNLGESISVVADYSYLTNQNREPISTQTDTFAEHRFFVGLEARFGAVRK